MGRDEGFAIADVSTALLDDGKVRHLWRLLAPDVSAMCEAMTVHEATLLASWREGRRVPAEQAAPIWLPVREEIVGRLVEVRLLDRSHRIPSGSWNGWFSPAFERREAKREGGRRGGLAKAEHRASSARAELYPSVPSLPTVPSAPSRARARDAPASSARDADPRPLREIVGDPATFLGPRVSAKGR